MQTTYLTHYILVLGRRDITSHSYARLPYTHLNFSERSSTWSVARTFRVGDVIVLTSAEPDRVIRPPKLLFSIFPEISSPRWAIPADNPSFIGCKPSRQEFESDALTQIPLRCNTAVILPGPGPGVTLGVERYCRPLSAS